MKRILIITALVGLTLSGCTCGESTSSKSKIPKTDARLMSINHDIPKSPTVRVFCIEGLQYVSTYSEGGLTQVFRNIGGVSLPAECI